jgi:hypothetical protein
MKLKNSFIVLACLICSISNLDAVTYYVRSVGGSDSNNGTTESTAFQTLEKVFSLATLKDGDIIDISGTFNYNIGKTLTQSITIQGKDNTKAIIQGVAGTQKRCFSIGTSSISPTVLIENVTFQNFDFWDDNTSLQGGVLQVNSGSGLVCRNVNFINNQAYSGGAVNIAGGTVVFEDCYFYNNKSKRRTEGRNADGGAINVSLGNTISSDISLTINRCLFEKNTTENIASAVRYRTETTGKSYLLIQNSTFIGNIVKHPSTSNTSGVVYLDVKSENAETSLINNTIAYNKSEVDNPSARAGLSVGGVENKVELINNILYSNTNAVNSDVSISVSVKLKESRNNITSQHYKFENNTQSGFSTSNLSRVKDVNLGLASTLSSNGGVTKVLAISATSVAVNNGFTLGVPDVDQRNFKRDGKPDVGAFEYTSDCKK